MIIYRFSLIVLSAMLLSSCSEKISDEDLICAQSPGLIGNAGKNTEEQLEVAKTCIHKWAYRLGRAPGSNSEIAKAVMATCVEATDRLLEMKLAEKGPKSPELFVNDAAWKQQLDALQAQALFRVVQGRAGQCSIRGEDQK